MAFMDFIFGKGEKQTQYPRYSTQQQSVVEGLLGSQKDSLGSLTEFLQSLLSPEGISSEEFSAPAMRQFQEQIIPSIAERFNSQFGPESLNTEAFARALGGAGAGLAENLAVRGAELGQQGRQQGLGAASLLQNLLGIGLQPQFETGLRPGTPGLLGQTAGSAASLLPLKLLGLF